MIDRTLAHYEITGLLGKGGMGEVYRAHDTKLDRDVALKILPAALAADASRLERFNREAKTVAALNHPHIVHMYSVEEDQGVHFLTMELVDGEELADRIPPDGLPLRDALEIAIAIADALSEAHSKGVTHRDLKPANVMIAAAGRVKVLDFGLAKLAQDDGSNEATVAGDDATRALGLTQEGTVLGTASYMSPEQLRGQEVDARTDVFALGVILHELVTGRKPFTGDTHADIVSSILKDVPVLPSSIHPALPARLDSIMKGSLEKDRDARTATTDQIANDLRGLLHEVDSGISEPGAHSPAAESSRWRVRNAAFAVASIILVAAFAFVWWQSSVPGSGSDEGRPLVVAVLPFENLGTEEDEYFAAGITDEITSRLALIDGLSVISRTSARGYAGTDLSIREVGRELGTDYIIEGAIRWDKTDEPGRVRITPRLINVADDTNIWSSNYEREVTAIFELQAEIASRIADALDLTLVGSTRDALGARPTQDIDAYQAYLLGMKELHAPGFSREGFTLGVQMFERAVAIDPHFALAYAQLSSMHSRMYHFGYDRTDERLRLAKNAVDRALALEPGLAEAYVARGLYHYWGTRQYEVALVNLETAREIAPNNSDALLNTAYVKRRQGNFAEAIELLERDRELSPRDPNAVVALGETYATMRRYVDAEGPLQRSIDLAPDDPYPYTELALLYLRWRGDVTAAREVLRAMPEVENGERFRAAFLVELLGREFAQAIAILDSYSGDVFEAGAFYLPVDLLKGMAHQASGDADAATDAFEAARSMLQARYALDPEDHRIHSSLGLAYAGLGRADEAIEHSSRAVELLPLEADALSAPVQIYHLALTHAMLGNVEEAIDNLEIVLSIPSTISVVWIEADPRWDTVRAAPGFATLR